MSFTWYTNAQLDIDLLFTFEDGAPIQSLVGATVRADAVLKGGAAYPGTVTILDAQTAHATWAAGSMPMGGYEIQVHASKAGAAQVAAVETFTMRQGAF